METKKHPVNDKHLKNLQPMIAGLLVLVVAAFYLYPMLFAMPSYDDFDYASQLIHGPLQSHGILISILLAISHTYKVWQGNYFSFFILYLEAALFGLNMYAVRVVLAVNILLLLLGLFMLIRMNVRMMHLRPPFSYITLLWFLVIAVGMNRASPQESLYWLNASCIYTLPFALSFLGISQMHEWLESGSRRTLILASLFGFLAAGGILMVAAFVNIFYVVLLFNHLRKEKSFSFRKCIPFLFVFSGALINALAPGNLVRARGVDSNGISISLALRNTLIVLAEVIGQSIRKDYLLSGCLAACLLTFLMTQRKAGSKSQPVRRLNQNPFLIILEILLILYVTMLPVVYGYNRFDHMPLRFYFPAELLTAALFISFSVFLGLWFREKSWGSKANLLSHKTMAAEASGLKSADSKASCRCKEFPAKWFPAVAVLLFCIANAAVTGKSDMLLFNMGYEIRHGQLSQFRADEETILQQIEASDEDVVIVTTPLPHLFTLKDFNLKPDSEDGNANQLMADYFEKDYIYYSPAVK